MAAVPVTAQPLAPSTELSAIHAEPLVATAAPPATDLFRGLSSVLVSQESTVSGGKRHRVSRVPPAHGGGAPEEAFLYAAEAPSKACHGCLPCRALRVDVHAGGSKSAPVALTMAKDWHYCVLPWPALLHPLCCVCAIVEDWILATPAELHVGDAGGAATGVVHDPPGPAFWCNGNSIVRDAGGRDVFIVGPHSLWRGLLCAPCVDDVVPVFAAATGGRVATFTRPRLTCRELFLKTNRVVIDFEHVRDPAHRSLLFAAALLFDHSYWSPSDKSKSVV